MKKNKPLNTKKLDTRRILTISDQHQPYSHPDMFKFLAAIKKKYKPTLVVNGGDECFPPTAQVLTPEGWTTFDKLDKTQKVMQYDSEGILSFVNPSRHIQKEFSGNLIQRSHGNHFSLTTPNHDIVLKNHNNELVKHKAFETGSKHYEIPRTGSFSGPGLDLTDDQIRLTVAVSADFSIREGGDVYGCLKKERKQLRLKNLLNSLKLRYSANPDARGYLSCFIHRGQDLDFLSKEFNSKWLEKMTKEQAKVFIDELAFWDGHIDPKRNRIIYCSSRLHNIGFVQALCHMNGIEASFRQVNSEFGISYQVSMLNGKNRTLNNSVISEVPYSGDVFCVTVPSGMLLVRQNNSVTVTGNCDAHALSFHDSDADLPSAGDELKKAIVGLKKLEKMFPNMLLLDSNHGSMTVRKAKHHGIPIKFLASLNEVYGVGPGWQWVNDLTVTLPNGKPVYMCHGMTKQGIKLASQRGTNVVQFHFHTDFRIDYIGNPSSLLWSMQAGCLIDRHSLAFAYDKLNLNRPVIGTAVIIDSKPILIPMEIDPKTKRWMGKL